MVTLEKWMCSQVTFKRLDEGGRAMQSVINGNKFHSGAKNITFELMRPNSLTGSAFYSIYLFIFLPPNNEFSNRSLVWMHLKFMDVHDIHTVHHCHAGRKRMAEVTPRTFWTIALCCLIWLAITHYTRECIALKIKANQQSGVLLYNEPMS